MLRIMVIGAPPNCDGLGMPQCAGMFQQAKPLLGAPSRDLKPMNESPLARQNATRQSSLNHLLHRTLPERNKSGARHEGIRRGKIGMVEMSTVVFARQMRGPRQLSTTGVYAETPERGIASRSSVTVSSNRSSLSEKNRRDLQVSCQGGPTRGQLSHLRDGVVRVRLEQNSSQSPKSA